ncbi:MAG: helix-hairpin-helix domain-containing protein [Chitinophagaceae bacterium]
MKKNIWSDFAFTRNQGRAILVLLSLLFLLSLYFFIQPSLTHPKEQAISSNWDTLIANITWQDSNTKIYSPSYSKEEPAMLKPFTFNPNTLDSVGFAKMGMRPKLIKTILNYRNKGGKFYNKESLQRIYGLFDEEYRQLEAYIQIPESGYKNQFQKTKELLHIELNTADTSQLKKLPMIGDKLSQNIVQYRKQLGGFAYTEQLLEVYGISPETFEKIKDQVYVNKHAIQKLNLNAATYQELNMHPYLKGALAKAIADYRKQHGYQINRLDELKEIELVDEKIFRKIAPYLTLQ